MMWTKQTEKHCVGTAETLALMGRQEDQKSKTSPAYTSPSVPKKGGKRGGGRREEEKGEIKKTINGKATRN